MLKLTARNVLHHIKHTLEEGPARSTAISATSAAVGLAAGKREDAKKIPVGAIVAGALAKVGHFHTVGDGLMSGGATILGYRVGARMAKKDRPVSPEMPAMPRGAAPVAHRPTGHPAGRRRG